MKNTQSGQMLILVIIVVGLVLVNSLIIISNSFLFSESTNYSVQSQQSLDLAEAGIDKAVNALNISAGSYTGETTNLGDGSFSVTVTSPDSTSKLITSVGVVSLPNGATVKRTVSVTASKGQGVDFKYGVQSGEGGFYLNNNSVINGSVYSNGNVVMSNGTRINGDLIVAGGVAATADQSSDCTDLSCSGDVFFGTNTGGNSVADIAQSFKPSANNILSKVSLKLKKIGNPSDLTVKILADGSGNPDKNNVLATGQLSADLVTNSYGFIDVSFNTQPNLTAGGTYWIMIISSIDNSNYWAWQNNINQSYINGSPAWSANWQAKTPVWNSILGDLSFKTYMGGVITSASGSNGSLITGDAHAHDLSSLTVNGGAYYQTEENVSAGAYYPNSTDKPPAVMPISDAQMTQWETDAAQNIYSSPSGCVSSLGPGEYSGSITFSNGCNVSAKSPIWIRGNLTLSNNNKITLDPSFGSNSGVIIVDGTITLANNNQVVGTGTGNSQLMLISNYDSRTTLNPAITLANGGNNVVVYAANGVINISNNNTLQQITGWKIVLSNGVTLNYNSGFSSLFFNSGSAQSFSLVKGTYQGN